MMYYKLHESFGLRGWQDSPHALRHFPSGETMFLPAQEFQALSFCNGNFDCDGILVPNASKEIIKMAAEKGIVVPCTQKGSIAPKQEYKLYPCKYIRIAHWSITGKCNMRCRQCFMSAPQAKYGEISHDMALDIINQLADAGISQVNLSGESRWCVRIFGRLWTHLRRRKFPFRKFIPMAFLSIAIS